jgi:hypothetical protein
MLKQVKDIEVGDVVVLASGHTFTVAVIQHLIIEDLIAFFDSEGAKHGPYEPTELLEVSTET